MVKLIRRTTNEYASPPSEKPNTGIWVRCVCCFSSSPLSPLRERQVLPLSVAKSIYGLRAVFGEVYPDPVRVVSVGLPVDEMVSLQAGWGGGVFRVDNLALLLAWFPFWFGSVWFVCLGWRGLVLLEFVFCFGLVLFGAGRCFLFHTSFSFVSCRLISSVRLGLLRFNYVRCRFGSSSGSGSVRFGSVRFGSPINQPTDRSIARPTDQLTY